MADNFNDKQNIIAVLERSKLFADVPKAGIIKLVENDAGVLKHYKKGDTLISTGDPIKEVSVVLRGSIIINHITRDGVETVGHVLKERKTIGIESVEVKGLNSAFQYKALADTYIYSIPQKNIRNIELMGGSEVVEKLLLNMISLLAHENLRQHQKIYILTHASLRKRIMTFLYFEYEKTGTNEFEISFNRESLAGYLCVNRSALSRELSNMQKEGLLETKGKHFIISNEIIDQDDPKGLSLQMI